MDYIICVYEDKKTHYFFNKQTLLHDPLLAKRFNDLNNARNAVRHSCFAKMRYSILPIDIPEEKPAYLGAIVE